ncbi:LysM peptidoglycan-binding domain-containing protein [Methylomagnum ishizawai]|uniref:LysM peptidoglycan-binding domain-containing protein n=1 Tax=Methylomagnum ishizawai TaxID=1760988 RepID=UPI001C81876B|nr:LysM domain-containing protein [Methylomagnum ishizawai]
MAIPFRLNSPRFTRPWRSYSTRRVWSVLSRLALALCLSGGFASADTLELNPNHPDRYTVVRGDTLWDIAGRFLNRPWQWPEIWHINPEIRNPDLIYPGDTLVLSYVNGVPQIGLENAGYDNAPAYEDSAPDEQKLSPRIRSKPISQAIPTIPMNIVHPFLSRPQVVGPDELKQAPYVVAFADEHIVGGYGNRMFVRSIGEGAPTAYTVLRSGNPYKDPDTGEILGYEAVYIGDAHVEQVGDPATLFIERTEQEARIGDRLLPLRSEPLRLSFQPHAPKSKVRGHIVGVVNGVDQIGQYSIVALDRGTADGIEVGHVLQILQRGTMVRDLIGPYSGETVNTPEQKAGLLMVFRPYERVSYALVMHASRALHVLDAVQTP